MFANDAPEATSFRERSSRTAVAQMGFVEGGTGLGDEGMVCRKHGMFRIYRVASCASAQIFATSLVLDSAMRSCTAFSGAS